MPRPRKDDFFAPLRRQAAVVLATLAREIARREEQLHSLRRQAETWRATLGQVGSGPAMGINGAGRVRRGRPISRNRSAGRVDWDQVLASVPKRFGVDDIVKHPGARAKGRAQIYPALTRWEAAKKIRRVAKGQYEKLSGRGPGRPAGRPTKSTAKRKPTRRRTKMTAKRPAVAKRSRGRATQNGRVDWDMVLKALPQKFGAADVLKNPAAAAKGSAQVYPAIGRWVATKKAKKVATGQYQKL
jgi:hypothetical protein